MAGSSNLTSWVSTATASRGPRPICVGDLVGPADDELVGVGEALAGRERRPAVDDHRLVAQLRAIDDERDRHLDGARR